MSIISALYALAVVGVLGLLFGAGLAVASRVLSVEKDRRIEEVEAVLPGINCGACGFAGCAAYAEGMVKQDAEISLCSPGGQEVMVALGKILGKEVDLTKEKMVAQVHCRGNRERSVYKYDYKGVEDCVSAHILYGGDKVCPYGCLGLGSCIKICPVDAISYDEDNCVWVDKDKCISCGKCVDICPTGVIRMIPYSADRIVACNSTDKGGVTKKYCTVGCIGCKLCEKKSPEGGFQVENFLAKIDYAHKGEREEAAKACPPKCIIAADKK
ncbi:RnfABCDGE type electron transport complex subunit B [Marispirochaeta aestuarii]|uniref:Ion-translocating oxidoreductase complex subunit B n=1 Tax=Marispirochaeta aestuarii TaxID=1963862 RepID=A0A1Y1RWB8_9SPIO|nr:RnfABCDGE type electron transport complex subunit B [Marispirochaeta aestuarii]ORC34435.1 electron transporter RnfB [Marispirochaeta aestuarii]